MTKRKSETILDFLSEISQDQKAQKRQKLEHHDQKVVPAPITLPQRSVCVDDPPITIYPAQDLRITTNSREDETPGLTLSVVTGASGQKCVEITFATGRTIISFTMKRLLSDAAIQKIKSGDNVVIESECVGAGIGRRVQITICGGCVTSIGGFCTFMWVPKNDSDAISTAAFISEHAVGGRCELPLVPLFSGDAGKDES